MTVDVYCFAKSFTTFPGGRHRTDGKHSGEQFLEEVMIPRHKSGQKTTLDLTDVIGFPTSFLDGAFGEFAARFSVAEFHESFELKIDDDPTLEKEILFCLKLGAQEASK